MVGKLSNICKKQALKGKAKAEGGGGAEGSPAKGNASCSVPSDRAWPTLPPSCSAGAGLTQSKTTIKCFIYL